MSRYIVDNWDWSQFEYSESNDHIGRYGNLWTYLDETGDHPGCVYDTRDEAVQGLSEYVQYLENGPDQGSRAESYHG